MGWVERISEEMKHAMKAREATRLAVLRAIRAAFLHEMKKDGAETLDDATCLALLRRLEKQRHESIDAFEAAGRQDRADAERAELAVIAEFLPRLADEATTRAWVQQAIASTGATNAKEAGRVMGALMKAHKGDVDGGLAQRMLKELLGA